MRRWRYHARGLVLIPLAPVLLPLLGGYVAFQTLARALRWNVPTSRRGTWYWQVWWWYGYHGLYQIDWGKKGFPKRLRGIRHWCDLPDGYYWTTDWGNWQWVDAA